MCGITGIVSTNHKEVIEKMTDALIHRGPDGFGYRHFENLSIGHRRLSIIDLSDLAQQPFSFENYSITYNGEIYNYQNLRIELETLGHQFKSQSDTEVLLKAYIQWKETCLDKLDGMFAFAIFNSETNCLFAARDAFGVKPFYYSQAEVPFAFASEQKAFFEIPGFKKHLNPKAVFQYLALAKLELESLGLIDGIYELMPGHYLTYHIDQNQVDIYKWFRLKYNPSYSSKDTIDETLLKTQVSDSIASRLVSDVEVASCLSGGLDSSTISGVLNNLGKKDHHCFTAVFEGKSYDEYKWAKQVVDQTQSKWTTVSPQSADFKNDLEKIVYHHDIPFLSCSTYAQFKVFESIHQNGIKVSLDGQGADELFAGYDNHFATYMLQSLKTGNWFSYLKRFKKPHLLIAYTLKMIFAKTFSSYFKKSAFRKSQSEYAFIQDKLWKVFEEEVSLVTKAVSSNINQQLHHEFSGDILKNLLRTADRNGMAHSVEVRVPFADNRQLIETVFQIPGKFKINKHLLKQVAKSYIPKSIINRKDKIAFASPEEEWLFDTKDQLLSYIPEQDDEFVKWSALRKEWNQLLSKDHLEQRNPRLWRLIHFAIWRKVYGI